MEKINVLKFRYSDFIEGKNGLYVIGVERSPRLEPRYQRFYLDQRFTAFQKRDDLIYTTEINYKRLQENVKETMYKVEHLPRPISETLEYKEDYKDFTNLYPFKNKGRPAFDNGEIINDFLNKVIEGGDK